MSIKLIVLYTQVSKSTAREHSARSPKAVIAKKSHLVLSSEASQNQVKIFKNILRNTSLFSITHNIPLT